MEMKRSAIPGRRYYQPALRLGHKGNRYIHAAFLQLPIRLHRKFGQSIAFNKIATKSVGSITSLVGTNTSHGRDMVCAYP
jgi:hypothetical protein